MHAAYYVFLYQLTQATGQFLMYRHVTAFEKLLILYTGM